MSRQPMDRSLRAKYMIFFGPADAPRALLFDREHRFLAEVFDEDRMVVDQLMKSSRACPPPGDLVLDGVALESDDATCCFALG